MGGALGEEATRRKGLSRMERSDAGAEGSREEVDRWPSKFEGWKGRKEGPGGVKETEGQQKGKGKL